ncbi:MAG: LysR family transcriptional regulator [Betaproteobacteria bacterium RBG_19FT_COMBO_58_11]|nr:MAG: LysR family transcriptional regulator [Betaproteobacteria bacterium RBG_19FT_COMBO_58_11]
MMNYKQLHYFWAVAKTGSIVRACEQLNLTPQTISGQIGLLEKTLGVELFRRAGRRLELTETGRLALSYAEEIFQVGGELEEALRSHPGDRHILFRVGIADVVPKSIAYHLLAPAMTLPEPVRIVCREDKLERLLAELAIQRLDLVLADSPMPTEMDVKGYSHKLGECGISFFATPKLATLHGSDFPRALHGAPLLVPGENSIIRGRLMRWFGERQIQPRIVGEFDDSALMKAFGQSGIGIFIAPSVIADEVQRQYSVKAIGQTDDVTERFYAISVERRLTHPAVVAVTEAARQELFAKDDNR